MTFPISTVNTVPFCGACGWDVNKNENDDLFCDACGADLIAFGFGDLLPPTDLAAVGGSLQVTVTWTEAPDSSDLTTRINSVEQPHSIGATSPWLVAGLNPGDVVQVRVRTVLDGIQGPWSPPVSATALA